MVRLGRELPELPSELLFSDGELRVLATFGRSRKLSPPARLGEAVELVARLGGWLGRPREPPGAQLMWHGYTQLGGHDLRLPSYATNTDDIITCIPSPAKRCGARAGLGG